LKKRNAYELVEP